MRALFLVLTLVGMFSACSTTPQSPAQAVYASTATYDAALTVAVAYKNLPPCAPSSPPICSDPGVVATLQRADNVAFEALSSAQRVVRVPGQSQSALQTAVQWANEAVAAFSRITATLQRKP
jgi:hypothetical protein